MDRAKFGALFQAVPYPICLDQASLLLSLHADPSLMSSTSPLSLSLSLSHMEGWLLSLNSSVILLTVASGGRSSRIRLIRKTRFHLFHYI
jgi:hypothetical protein